MSVPASSTWPAHLTKPEDGVDGAVGLARPVRADKTDQLALADRHRVRRVSALHAAGTRRTGR